MSALPHFTRTPILAEEAKGKDIREIQGIHTHFDASRVKGQPTSQPHVKARLCDSVLPERGANIGDNCTKFTAVLSPQEN